MVASAAFEILLECHSIDTKQKPQNLLTNCHERVLTKAQFGTK